MGGFFTGLLLEGEHFSGAPEEGDAHHCIALLVAMVLVGVVLCLETLPVSGRDEEYGKWDLPGMPEKKTACAVTGYPVFFSAYRGEDQSGRMRTAPLSADAASRA